MSSQDTVPDPTLYPDMLPPNDCEGTTEVAEVESSPLSIQSASHTSRSTPEGEKASQDEKEDKGYLRGRPRNTADSLSHLVSQFDFNLTQLNARVEELRALISDMRNDASKKNNTNQSCKQEKNILKRAKRERDDKHQLIDCTQRQKKRPRVTWGD